MAENVLEPARQALEGDGGSLGAREIWNGLNESSSIFCHFAIRNTLNMN